MNVSLRVDARFEYYLVVLLLHSLLPRDKVEYMHGTCICSVR